MIGVALRFEREKPKKKRRIPDERDQIRGMFVRIRRISRRSKARPVTCRSSLERAKCLLAIGGVRSGKVSHARRLFWRKGSELMNKMLRVEMTRNNETTTTMAVCDREHRRSSCSCSLATAIVFQEKSPGNSNRSASRKITKVILFVSPNINEHLVGLKTNSENFDSSPG